ncbi:hypothetical protein N7495_002597 [Penicillium taxi]|uniref:uncharacterized protein n=1 Tax=Penicillium taxi TaxID=168475 RepID=UPI002544F594|nr:uncharacterized protein N7495_002597 [Penicillium taxi]KAJ5902069.1 hypothetical protein N7495_002597 [Penicillium taxi]
MTSFTCPPGSSQGTFSTLRSYLDTRRRGSNDSDCTEIITQEDANEDGNNVQIKQSEKKPYNPMSPTKRDLPCCYDTNLVVSQLPARAATVDPSSTSTDQPLSSSDEIIASKRLSLTTEIEKDQGEEEFYYLSSLITVSGQEPPSLRRQISSICLTEKYCQSADNKPALQHNQNTTSLPRRPGQRVPLKPVRYSSLPAVYVIPKNIRLRPEVRF